MKWSVSLYMFLLVTSIYSCQRDNMPQQQQDFPRLVPVIHQYGSEAPQFGQLRMPEREGKVPVIMIIHGGCWISYYNLDLTEKMAEALTQKGFATWNVEYRRVGNEGGGWPGTFNDVAKALDHLKELANTYPLDLEKVIVTGHSAGGHLSLYLGSIGNLDPESDIHQNNLPKIRGIVSLAGITDLKTYYQPSGCGSNIRALMGGIPSEFPERYKDGSPIDQLPFNVPQILIHGESDFIVPLSHIQPYYEMVKNTSDSIRLITLEKTGHFELTNPASGVWEEIEKVFLDLVK